jgi:hypothetical protein
MCCAMKIVRLFGRLTALLLGAYAAAGPAQTFTDTTAFLNALPGPAGVLAFDGLPGGTDLSGVTLNVTGGPGTGIVFPDSVLDWQGTPLRLQVVAGNPTSSPANSLGLFDPGNYNSIGGGTFIDLGLTAPVNAFGLSFITPDALYDDDIRLIAGNETASLLLGDRTLVGTFGGNPYYGYFLGIVASGSGFNSASIRYGAGTDGAFFFNADDLTLAVASTAAPAPGTPLLILGGALAALARRQRSSPPSARRDRGQGSASTP